jgi:hypothetical protein
MFSPIFGSDFVEMNDFYGYLTAAD